MPAPTVAWPSFEAVWALGQPLLKAAEGLRLEPYLCPTKVPSIGWGNTHYPDGRAVTLNDPAISETEAQVYLEAAAKAIYVRLQRVGAVTRAPTVHQAAALLLLAYNIGVGVHDGKKGDLADSTLLADFNAGNIPAAADQFLEWDKAHLDGKVVTLPGLDTRRHAERLLFLTPDANAA